jgi:hypothetical protein
LRALLSTGPLEATLAEPVVSCAVSDIGIPGELVLWEVRTTQCGNN